MQNADGSPVSQSRSPVLTATGLVNEGALFLTPTELTKNLLQVIMSRLLLLCKIWWKSIYGELLGK